MKKDLIDIHTQTLHWLGVLPLWVEEWAEVPERLGTVYGADWPKVFGSSAKSAAV